MTTTPNNEISFLDHSLSHFNQLPFDLLPSIIAHFKKPSHICSACLVSKGFYSSAIHSLYNRIAIYSWSKHSKNKVILLFKTLSSSPSLARFVHALVIRDFPKAQIVISDTHDDLIQLTVSALRNCINLKSCTWTRHGSLNSSIISVLVQLPLLDEIEINAHHQHNYDPTLLLSFTRLTRLSLIMPSNAIALQLPKWTQLISLTLKSLTIICKSSTAVTDDLLESLSQHLIHLDHFYLTNCTKATDIGVISILSNNVSGIVGLGLEGLSPNFDWLNFANCCSAQRLLCHLRSITMTLDPTADNWAEHVSQLLSFSESLEHFHVYSTSLVLEPGKTGALWKSIGDLHGTQLLRFSVHRIVMDLDSISYICTFCPRLEELFIVVQPKAMSTIGLCLAPSQSLHSLHMNYAIESSDADGADNLPILDPADTLKIVHHCSMSLSLVGVNTRVWQVQRELNISGGWTRNLIHYEGPGIPEAFLVVRT